VRVYGTTLWLSGRIGIICVDDYLFKFLGASFRLATKATTTIMGAGVKTGMAAYQARQSAIEASQAAPAIPAPRRAGVLRTWMAGVRYRDPHPVLPETTRMSSTTAGYSFGIPFPWEPVDVAALAGASSSSPDELPDLAVSAPRSDGRDPLFHVKAQPGTIDIEGEDLGMALHDLARANQAQPGRPRRLRLAGSRAVVLPVRSSQQEVHQLVVDAGDQIVLGYLVVPVDQASGYLEHFETMLGSWAWHP
jgi:hypothetical protein